MKERINKLVDKVINIYMKEDYDYMISLARNGQRPIGIDTVAEEVDFIKRNDLGDGLSDEELTAAAELILEKIKAIDDEAFAAYNK